MKTSFLSGPFFIILFSISLFGQPDVQDLDRYIDEAVKKYEMPGLAVGIIKDGNIILNKGYGFRNNETKTKVDSETQFGVASVTKAFTAACIGILVDRNLLNWDDKVIDHLPWFRLHDSYAGNDLKIIDLLTHRSGLGTFDGDLLWYGTDYSRQEIVERIRFQEPKHSLRSKYGYQNVMYIAAGEVIKSVTGMSWDDFLKENILIPLEMNSTTTTNSHFTDDDNVSSPHINGEPQQFINYDNSGPAASINSSTTDLLKWLEMWLNHGRYNNREILTSKTADMIISPQTVIRGRAGEKGGTHFYLYGIGWGLKDYAGRKIIEHSGGLPGVHTQVVFIPEDNLGIVLLSNQISGLIPGLTNKILDFYLTDKNIDYIEKDFTGWKEYQALPQKRSMQKEEERIKGTKASLPIEKYTGIYTDKSYGSAEVILKDGDLIMTLLPTKNLFVSKMEHWHYNTFRIRFADPFLPEGFVTFYIDGNGSVKNFTIDLPNPDFHFHDHDFVKTDLKD